MAGNKFFSKEGWIFVAVLVLVVFYLVTQIILFFSPLEDTLTINVEGACNMTYTNSTRYLLDYECMKWCNDHTGSSADRNTCWQECAKLGCNRCG
jgi:hypothetical protein